MGPDGDDLAPGPTTSSLGDGGIVDPTKAVRTALEDEVSAAGPGSRGESMGVRTSSGKNKKSKATTARNTVEREGVRTRAERARGRDEARQGVR
jgi:hypothetical protein